MGAFAFLTILAAIVIADLHSRIIPNTLIVFGLFLFLLNILWPSVHLSPSTTALTVLSGTITALLLTLPGWFVNKLGGGDVKLSLLLGAALGPLGFLWSVVLAVPFGLVFSGWCRFRERPVPADLPVGAFLAGGAGLVVIGTTWPLA